MIKSIGWATPSLCLAIGIAIGAADAQVVGPDSTSKGQRSARVDSMGVGVNAARPLSLQEAVQLAESQSKTIRIARNAVRRASGQQYQARSNLFPQLNGTANYTRTLKSQFQGLFNDTSSKSSSSGSGGGIDFTQAGFGAANAYTLGLAGALNLFTGGRTLGLIQSATAGRRAAEIDLSAQRAQVILDVTHAYYDAALADRLLAIAESTLVQAEAQLRQTQLQQKVGNTSEFELLRATVARDNQRPIVIQRQSDRDVAYLRLKQQLNLSLDAPVRLTTAIEDSTVVPPGVTIARAAAPDTVTDRRAVVREASENVTAQRGLLRVARSQRLPSLQLSSIYNRVSYPKTGIPAWDVFRPNWTVTLATSLPFFTGGRIRGDELIAEANLRDARDRLQQAREFAALDAHVALNTLQQAEATLQASTGTAAQAQRAYQIAEVRYREGISTQLELNDARNQLQQALANRAFAARNVLVARVRLALLPDLPLPQQTTGTTGATSNAASNSTGSSMSTTPQAATSGPSRTNSNDTTPF